MPAFLIHGFGRQRGDELLAGGDAADRLAHQQLLVGGLDGGRVRGRDLLLAVAELGVVLLDRDLLGVERGDQRVGVVLRSGGGDRREAQPGVHRHEPALLAAGERELVLEGGAQDQPAFGEPAVHPLEEAALADGGGGAVELEVIGEHGAGRGRVGEHAEGVEIRHQAELADRPEAVDRLQLVEPVHRLHRAGHADAAREPALQAVPAGGLGADRPVIAAPEKAHEPQLARLAHDLLQIHAGIIPEAGMRRGAGRGSRGAWRRRSAWSGRRSRRR